ncbi:hypothetical protein [Pantoea sp. GM_Pan_4]|uniref:hypothetical protein n=1 Tax=Pantoea sp. GM_Pan_4 TaxID=2937389 RepID=UPI00226A740B|nr:hypothetical protein [Pantoea sp. GM_Pan_4]
MEAKKMPDLTVWYGAMPETNGKSNWTAILHRKGECISTGITIDRSEYPERVRYEADRMRHLIGELQEKPDILAYDANKHSGYVNPATQAPVLKPVELPPTRAWAYGVVECVSKYDVIAAIRAAGYEVKQ